MRYSLGIGPLSGKHFEHDDCQVEPEKRVFTAFFKPGPKTVLILEFHPLRLDYSLTFKSDIIQKKALQED